MRALTPSLLFVALLIPALATALAPDRILYNGKILTVDAELSVATAISIRGNRIAAVGATRDIRKLAGPETIQVDLAGRTVIPGLIDSHIHYLRGTNFAAYETRIHGTTSRAEALERIATRARELGPGKWIFIMTIPVDDIRNIEPVMTIVGGEIVFERD